MFLERFPLCRTCTRNCVAARSKTRTRKRVRTRKRGQNFLKLDRPRRNLRTRALYSILYSDHQNFCGSNLEMSHPVSKFSRLALIPLFGSYSQALQRISTGSVFVNGPPVGQVTSHKTAKVVNLATVAREAPLHSIHLTTFLVMHNSFLRLQRSSK